MIPNATKRKLFEASIDYVNDTIKIALIDNSVSYSPSQDSEEFVADILDGGTTASEYADTNYTRPTLSGTVTNQDNMNDRGTWDANDVTFSNLGSANGDTIQAVVVFKQVTDDTDSPVLRVLDDSEESALPQGTNGSDVVIQWHADGIKYIG